MGNNKNVKNYIGKPTGKYEIWKEDYNITNKISININKQKQQKRKNRK